jgi:hypothetical protein
MLNLSAILAALSYAPFVSAAVQQIEQTQAALPGASKKQIVMASIGAAAHVGQGVPEAHVQVISALVDILVSSFNAAGLFKSATPAPAVIAFPDSERFPAVAQPAQ